MSLPFALLQGTDTKTMLIMLGVITLGILVALGKRFFVSMFEVITAPGASLGHYGRENNAFFSLFIVFLGGLIGLFYLTLQQPQISSKLSETAMSVGQGIAQGNSNANYRDIA